MKKKLPKRKKSLPSKTKVSLPSKSKSNQVEVPKFEIEYLGLDEIKLWGKNPRLNDEGAKKLAALIKKNKKFVDPIVIDQNGIIRAGNTRYKAARILKLEKVPCVRVHWEKEGEAVLYAIANNKAHEYTGWDAEVLAEAFSHKDVMGFDMTAISGFSDKELRGIDWGSSEEFVGSIRANGKSKIGTIIIECPKSKIEKVKTKVIRFIEGLEMQGVEVK